MTFSDISDIILKDFKTMKRTDPAVSAVSIKLEISTLWWQTAELIPKNSESILLNEDNESAFLKKAEVGDIFEGTTRDGAIIQGSIAAKDATSITLGENVSIS